MAHAQRPVTIPTTRFRNRRAAGRALAAALHDLELNDPVVIGLPRGGVPVAFEVATNLGAPLDVLGAGKLGAPSNPELAVGAVAEDGTVVLDQRAASAMGLKPGEIRNRIAQLIKDVAERAERYREGKPMIEVASRQVVLVDDGLGTGLTCLAAIRALRRCHPARVVLAVPVAAGESLAKVAPEADDVVCRLTPSYFVSVGSWYDDFRPVPEATVLELLKS